MESIWEHVQKAIDDDTLNDDILDEYEKKDAVRFASGAKEGILLFHGSQQKNEELYDFLISQLNFTSHEEAEKAVEVINEYFHNHDVSLFTTGYDVGNYIIENHHKIKTHLLYHVASDLLFETSEIEVVKLGLCLISLFDVENDPELLENLVRFGLCEEFTFYVNNILNGMEGANEIRFNLVRQLHGWGKIFVVRTLENNTPEINDWLLKEGIKNDILPCYLADAIAEKVHLSELLAKGEINDSILEIMDGLLMDEDPMENLDYLEDGEKIIESFIALHDKCHKRRYYDILKRIKAYLKKKGLGENDPQLVKITSILQEEIIL